MTSSLIRVAPWLGMERRNGYVFFPLFFKTKLEAKDNKGDEEEKEKNMTEKYVSKTAKKLSRNQRPFLVYIIHLLNEK